MRQWQRVIEKTDAVSMRQIVAVLRTARNPFQRRCPVQGWDAVKKFPTFLV